MFQGITYKDFSDFSHLLRSIADVDTALTFYHMAGASINQDTLNHVASTVANLHLSPHVLDVVFTLFDENSKSVNFVYILSNIYFSSLFIRSLNNT